MPNPLVLDRYDAQGALALREQLEELYEATHLDVADNEFYSRERFWKRLVEWYAPADGFELVVASIDGTPVGFAFGCIRPTAKAVQLWKHVRRASLPGLEAADPEPVFVFNELAVDPDVQRQGVGRALHDALLTNRPEPIATLTVRPNNPARGYYGHWGWAKVAEVENEGFPLFEALVLNLRHRPAPNRDLLDLRRYGPAGALSLRAEILPVYAASHSDMMHDPWFHPDRFWERLIEFYAPGRDFELVAAWIGNVLIGYAFGSPRDKNVADIWNEVRGADLSFHVPADVLDEPVYIFREFAVHPLHQRHGFGQQIHDELLRSRPERVANLLVRPDNRARGSYVRWGWEQFGTKRPFDDSPLFDNMIKQLR